MEATGPYIQWVIALRRRPAVALCVAMVGTMLTCPACAWDFKGVSVSGRLDPALQVVEQRLSQEGRTDATDPNSPAYQRAVGEAPARSVAPRNTTEKRVLSLAECLQLAFAQNNEIKQDRERMVAAGGSKLIANSRFLPTLDLIGQYERVRDFENRDASADASFFGAQVHQRVLEWGKDNPIDISLRAEQREALFWYEQRVASVFSEVRRAFLFILLKSQQIAARQELLKQFETQARTKEQRMAAGNLSVKIEVLTARLNVLNERTRINTLERQRFNRQAELLRLIGLPVGADQVEFTGRLDPFGLGDFDMDAMVRLALAQSSEVALAETLVAEQDRALRQLRYEYIPDLRMVSGYQDEAGRVGASVTNEDETWGLDVLGQPGVRRGTENAPRGVGLFAPDFGQPGPDAGWFAGVEARVPLTDGGARTGRRMQTRAELNRLQAAAADRADLVELAVRQGYKLLSEQKFQVDLAQENVNIERERFGIQEELRDAGKVTDDNLETFRRAFFAAQDTLFQQQEVLIDRQENLRLAIRYFKP